MIPKKASKKKKSSAKTSRKSISEYQRIWSFLKRHKRSFPESAIIEEVFRIPIKTEGFVPSPQQLSRLQQIRAALRQLRDEKKIIVIMSEDSTTKEEVILYSSTGWFVSPDDIESF